MINGLPLNLKPELKTWKQTIVANVDWSFIVFKLRDLHSFRVSINLIVDIFYCSLWDGRPTTVIATTLL